MSGWILLHKDIRNHWLWKNPERLKWWIDILMTVNYEDKEVSIGHKNFVCKRGEALMSIESWAKRWMVSKSAAYNFLMLIRKQNMIRIANETVTTRLTVCNYDTYQQPTNGIQTQNKRITNESRVQLKEEKKETKKEDKMAAPAFSVSELKKMFDVFRKKHGGGGKRSLDVEFEHFKKKHKDWREVIPTLPDIIDKHIEYRKRLESTGGFVANWKNFSTWVNNRCWTEELDPIEVKTTSNGQLPIDFKPEVEYFINGKGGIETMVNKETRLTITGYVHKEYKDGEMRYADEQGREITKEEYNEKKQLQNH